MKIFNAVIALSLFPISYCPLAVAQQPDSVTFKSGRNYTRTAAHRWIFGADYRKEWSTPVKMEVVRLDTVYGGLTAYEAGGGRQSKTLRLKDIAGREYVIRSIEKSYGKALPESVKGTFVVDWVNDQVVTAHPYAPITIPGMASPAGIKHTAPRLVYIRKASLPDSFKEEYGDAPYLLEQRPDGNWENAENLGNSEKIISTEKLREKILKSYKNQVDQKQFVKSRLFDFWIGDWSRHEDQWRWASQDSGEFTRYVAIPRDRDQAYFLIQGKLTRTALSFADLKHMQSFKDNISNLKRFNFGARNLDRRFTNELAWSDWEAAAKELQQVLTDEVIEKLSGKCPGRCLLFQVRILLTS